MTTTPVENGSGFRPLYMKDVTLRLGDEGEGTDFKCEVRSVTLTPDTNIARVKTLCPSGQFSEVDDPEWNLEIGYLYGTHADREALGQFLLSQKGTKVPFLFHPRATDASEGYTGVVTVVPGALGGEQGSFSEQSVSLPVDGQPAPVSDGAEAGAQTQSATVSDDSDLY